MDAVLIRQVKPGVEPSEYASMSTPFLIYVELEVVYIVDSIIKFCSSFPI